MRSPASGSARKHPQPDILASDGDQTFGIEAKASSSDSIYIPVGEIEKLEEFCRKFGCRPMIGVRFQRKDWTFFNPEDCTRTKKSYKVTRDMAGWNLVEGEGFCRQKTFSESND